MDNVKYLVKPSKFDSRDFKYTKKFSAIKPSVDLREWDSLVEDQGKLGSCVGNAIANSYELLVKKLHPAEFVDLSRLFIYYNARIFDGTVAEDVGAYIRNGLKGVKLYGVCKESLWPYTLDKVDDQPTPDCYTDARKRLITRYESLVTLRDMLETLSDGIPIVVGMAVYESFDFVDEKNPVIPMPTKTDPYIGGHAISIVGYDLEKKYFLIKNSYGTTWGYGGYAWLPFEYLRTQGFEQWRFEINNQGLQQILF